MSKIQVMSMDLSNKIAGIEKAMNNMLLALESGYSPAIKKHLDIYNLIFRCYKNPLHFLQEKSS